MASFRKFLTGIIAPLGVAGIAAGVVGLLGKTQEMQSAGDQIVRRVSNASATNAPTYTRTQVASLDRLFARSAGTQTTAASGDITPNTTLAGIALERAEENGSLEAMRWACEAKTMPCEILAALSQLESSSRPHAKPKTLVKGSRLTASGLWQITDPEFLSRTLAYGPEDSGLIRSYLNTLKPGSEEALKIQSMLNGIEAAGTDKYQRDPHFRNHAHDQIKAARGVMHIEALWVVDCLKEDLNYFAKQTGMPPGQAYNYSHFTHFLGRGAAVLVYQYAADPRTQDVNAAAVLTKFYKDRALPDNPTKKRIKNATENAETRVASILGNNAKASNITAKQLVEKYYLPFASLAAGIRANESTNPRISLNVPAAERNFAFRASTSVIALKTAFFRPKAG